MNRMRMIRRWNQSIWSVFLRQRPRYSDVNLAGIRILRSRPKTWMERLTEKDAKIGVLETRLEEKLDTKPMAVQLLILIPIVLVVLYVGFGLCRWLGFEYGKPAIYNRWIDGWWVSFYDVPPPPATPVPYKAPRPSKSPKANE